MFTAARSLGQVRSRSTIARDLSAGLAAASGDGGGDGDPGLGGAFSAAADSWVGCDLVLEPGGRGDLFLVGSSAQGDGGASDDSDDDDDDDDGGGDDDGSGDDGFNGGASVGGAGTGRRARGEAGAFSVEAQADGTVRAQKAINAARLPGLELAAQPTPPGNDAAVARVS